MFLNLSKKELNSMFRFVPQELLSRTFVIGGFVRDLIMDKESNDIDYVVINSSHKEMISLGFTQVGADFPVYLDKYGNEFALARQERKTGKGFLGFSFITENVTLIDDQRRRDFTCNSMAIDYLGNFYDPFNGYEDIKNKIFRHVSDAFAEDPVRVLRLARFSARYTEFSIHSDTRALVTSLRPELESLTPERMYKEMEKALSLDTASIYFRTLYNLGVLDLLFPELFVMVDCYQPYEFHAEGCVFEHSLRVLDQACLLSKSVKVRFAALFHDIGKPSCFIKYGNFNGHSSTNIVLEQFSLFQKRLRIPNNIIDFSILIARLHHKFHNFDSIGEKSLEKMLFAKSFPKKESDLNDLIFAIKSDSLGRIVTDPVTGRTLTKEEADLVFQTGIETFDGEIYIQGHNDLNIEYLRFLFQTQFLKSRAGEYINSSEVKPSVDAIKNFTHNEKLDRIKSIRRHFISD